MYIDLHCDTVMKYIKDKKPQEIFEGKKSHIGLKELYELKVKAQFMAIYLPSKEDLKELNLEDITDWEYVDRALNFYSKIEDSYPDKFKVTSNYKEYLQNKEKNIVSLFPTIEDGRLIENVEQIKELNEKKITLITLLWNNENGLGCPHSYSGYEEKAGLKPLGLEVLKEMEFQKIIIDVSHLNEQGISDVLNNTTKPFVASHSNARAVTDVTRNLSDIQLKSLGERGCVAGLNLCPKFSSPDPSAMTTFKDYENHIRHMLDIGGEDLVCLGTDFDGIGGEFEISRPHRVIDFLNYLNTQGLPASIVEKIAYKNVERFFEEYN